MGEKLPQISRRVLIVDDESDWRDRFGEKFSEAGVEAVIVGSVDEAREALKKGGFTEILTDGLGGKWEQVAESAAGLPVRLVTGDSSFELKAKGKGVGYVDKGDLDALRNIAK